MTGPPRCGNCGRFAGVTYEWFGPSYGETIYCENCGPAAYQYDPFAAALGDMTGAEIREGFFDG